MIIKLTQAFINQYQIAEGKYKIELVDDAKTGLYLNMTATTKTFMLRYKSPATCKTTHIKLGKSSDISLAQARDLVKQYRAQIALGNDPQLAVKAKRQELTYDEFMVQHYLPHIKNRLRKYKEVKRQYEIKLKPIFGNMKISSIRKAKVQLFHSDIKNSGLSGAYANRQLALFKASFNYGIKMEIMDCKNPGIGISLFHEQAKDRILSVDELSRLIPVLLKAEGQFLQPARIIRFLLSTGLRVNECLNCRWADIDLINKRLYIHSDRSKNKKSQSIPLNASAIEVLNECDRAVDYPLANHSTGKPYYTIKKSFKSLMKQAGITEITQHDLRRTAGSIMLNNGRSLLEVQRFLRHSSPITTEKHYARLTTATLQEATDTISEQLFRAASGSN